MFILSGVGTQVWIRGVSNYRWNARITKLKKNIKEEEEEIGRLKYHLLLSILFERPLEEKTQQAHTIIKNCTLSVLLEKKTIFTNILKNIERWTEG